MHRTVYFAGELFSLKHLIGNASLAEMIEEQSAGKYRCMLPQNIEQRDVRPAQIRNSDLHCLLHCDLGLFHFDGPELDSGTVTEFLFAKFLDIPAVILRTDFRAAGDQDLHPWNLMLVQYPRTEVVLCDSLGEYQRMLRSTERRSLAAAMRATEELAQQVIAALDRAQAVPPLLAREQQGTVYEWARIFPGADFSRDFTSDELASLIERKRAAGLLAD